MVTPATPHHRAAGAPSASVLRAGRSDGPLSVLRMGVAGRLVAAGLGAASVWLAIAVVLP